MIKRRFYRQEHGERDGASSGSSSSSESDIEPHNSSEDEQDSDAEPNQEPLASDAEPDTDNEKDEKAPSFKPQSPSSSSSGYESEDSSGNEIEAQSADLDTDDEDSGAEREEKPLKVSRKKDVKKQEAVGGVTVPDCILRCKSVFKCKLCPKIVCLNEESLKTHLNSKKHARSVKLHESGRLKRMLNSDGEEEVVSDDEDGETHAERHARIIALAQSKKPEKKLTGRQRQKERLKKKKQEILSEKLKSGQTRDNRAKRRRKNVE